MLCGKSVSGQAAQTSQVRFRPSCAYGSAPRLRQAPLPLRQTPGRGRPRPFPRARPQPWRRRQATAPRVQYWRARIGRSAMRRPRRRAAPGRTSREAPLARRHRNPFNATWSALAHWRLLARLRARSGRGEPRSGPGCCLQGVACTRAAALHCHRARRSSASSHLNSAIPALSGTISASSPKRVGSWAATRPCSETR